MGRLEDMKRAAANKPVAALSQKQPVNPVKQPQPANKSPTDKAEIKRRCGHPVAVHAIEASDCKSCQQKRKSELRAKRRKAKADNGVDGLTERLPVGAVKTLAWDGSTWEGVLSIPGCRTFTFQATSEKRCFHGLHDEWVKWKKDKENDSGNEVEAKVKAENGDSSGEVRYGQPT